jgi:hypothetical protein
MSKRTIEINRTKQYANKVRTIGIYINNKKIDTILNTKFIDVL